MNHICPRPYFAPAFLLLSAAVLRAAVLNGTDAAAGNDFGAAVHIGTVHAAVGAPRHSTTGATNRGAAYLFRSVSGLTGAAAQNAKLLASDGAAQDNFGSAVAVDASNSVLVGAPGHNTGGTSDRGAAYVFRSLTTATGTVNQAAKLQSTSGSDGDFFGTAVASQSNVGLVGAPGSDFLSTVGQGVVYLYNNLDTITGTVTQNSILVDSGGAANDNLGSSLAMWLDTAVAGSAGDDVGANNAQGSACYFRGLYAATALTAQAAKLTASDGAAEDRFGSASGLSGDANSGLRYAVIGAPMDNIGSNPDQGSAYLYRIGLTATGALTQNAKLTAAGGAVTDHFGSSVSVSSTTALVGAPSFEAPGYACLYLNLDTLTGTVNEAVRLWPADGFMSDGFGSSVSLAGDIIVIGAESANGTTAGSGKAYTASLATLTTFDTTSATRTIENLNFRSRTNWIIGDTRDGMTLTLNTASSAELALAGTAISIGRTGTSDNNRLIVEGAVIAAPAINVGSGASTGNELRVNGGVTATAITIRNGSILSGDGQIFGPVTINGSLRPGEGTNRATLTVGGHFTWTTSDPWQFDLAAANASDRLNIIGPGGTNYNFLKGTGSAPRNFDFLGSAQPGTYTLVTWDGTTTFTAADFAAINVGGGLTASFAIAANALTVTLGNLTPIQQWRQTHFGNPANTGNGADTFDFDKDDLPNLIEYALGTNPTLASSSALPVVGQSGGRLTLRFTPQVVSGLNYTIQTSSDLSVWSTVSVLSGLTAGTQHTWTDTVLMTGPLRRYVRLRVSY